MEGGVMCEEKKALEQEYQSSHALFMYLQKSRVHAAVVVVVGGGGDDLSRSHPLAGAHLHLVQQQHLVGVAAAAAAAAGAAVVHAAAAEYVACVHQEGRL